MIETIKKHGVTGLLVVWLLQLQIEVAGLKADYKDCIEDRIEAMRFQNQRMSEFILPKDEIEKPPIKGVFIIESLVLTSLPLYS